MKFFSIATLAIAIALYHGAEGAAWGSREIVCLEEAPQVCVVQSFFTTPSPVRLCSDDNLEDCETNYSGGWSWSFSIAENLDDGINTDIDVALEAAGLNVEVELDDDEVTCRIYIAGDECNSCSVEGCGDPNLDWSASIRYDCTNLENGRSSEGECMPLLEPFLYPFLLATTEISSGSSLNITDGDVPDSNDITPDSNLSSASNQNGVSPNPSDTTNWGAPDSNVEMVSVPDDDHKNDYIILLRILAVIGPIFGLVGLSLLYHHYLRKKWGNGPSTEEKPDDETEKQLDDITNEQV